MKKHLIVSGILLSLFSSKYLLSTLFEDFIKEANTYKNSASDHNTFALTQLYEKLSCSDKEKAQVYINEYSLNFLQALEDNETVTSDCYALELEQLYSKLAQSEINYQTAQQVLNTLNNRYTVLEKEVNHLILKNKEIEEYIKQQSLLLKINSDRLSSYQTKPQAIYVRQRGLLKSILQQQILKRKELEHEYNELKKKHQRSLV